MAAFTNSLTMPGTPFQWNLLFARQPEPDLEFTDEELEQTTPTRPRSPMKPSKKSGGGRPRRECSLAGSPAPSNDS